MKRFINNTVFILLLFLISTSIAKELALKKISDPDLKEQEKYFSEVYGESIIIPRLNGMLKVGDVSYKTSAPFYLNNNVSWGFSFKFSSKKYYELVNDNSFLKWYKKSENGGWKEIKGSKFQFIEDREVEFLIKYKKANTDFQVKNPLQPQPFCGFAVPLYLKKTDQSPFKISVNDYSLDNTIRISFTNIDSVLLGGKFILMLSTPSGKVYHTSKFLFNEETQHIVTKINKIVPQKNSFNVTITAYVSNRKIFEKNFLLNKKSYSYHPPYFEMNGNPVQLFPVKFIPNFNYISLFLKPSLQKEIFLKLKGEGYNSIIIPAEYFNPVVLKNSVESGLAVILNNVNEDIYVNIIQKGWVGQNLTSGFVWKEDEMSGSQLFKGIHFCAMNLINDSIPKIPNEKFAPYLKLSYNYSGFLSKIVELYKTKGGLLVNSGFHYNKSDSIIAHEMYFNKTINLFKLNSHNPVSACMFNLTAHNSIYPFSFVNNVQNEFHKFPNYLLDSNGFKEKESKNFITFAKSPVPETVMIKNYNNNEFLFILFGVLNFFAFTFYLLRLKSFKLYFMRAIKNPHGFFMDLNEKIAVPWSETLFLALFTGIGLTTTLGSFLSVFNKSLVSNNIFNLIFIKPELTKLLFKALDKPITLIITGFVLYFLYLFFLTISIRLSFFIFKKRIKMKHCWAISVWSHVLLAIYILFGLIAYNSIVLLHVSYEFWMFLAFVLLLSFFRFNRAIFITSGFKLYRIYLVSFLFVGIIISIFYFADYPFTQTYFSIKMLMKLYH